MLGTCRRTLDFGHLYGHSSFHAKIARNTVTRAKICFSGPQASVHFSQRNFSLSGFRQSDHNTPLKPPGKTLRENIYTLPNLLTVTRICACPVLGWSILEGDFHLATSLLVFAGLTDLADGWIARRFNMSSVLGTVLDPAADKTLMTTLVVTLTMKGLLPTPLAVVILGRDVLLSISAFYIRYTSLPHPKTFARYWDFSIPSAEVKPTEISKINTALQLLLMGVTTAAPISPLDLVLPLQGLQWIVATTTVWSGCSYLFAKDVIRIVKQKPPSS